MPNGQMYSVVKDDSGQRVVWLIQFGGREEVVDLEGLRTLMHNCLTAYDEEAHLLHERALQRMMVEPKEKSVQRVLRQLE